MPCISPRLTSAVLLSLASRTMSGHGPCEVRFHLSVAVTGDGAMVIALSSRAATTRVIPVCLNGPPTVYPGRLCECALCGTCHHSTSTGSTALSTTVSTTPDNSDDCEPLGLSGWSRPTSTRGVSVAAISSSKKVGTLSHSNKEGSGDNTINYTSRNTTTGVLPAVTSVLVAGHSVMV